MTNKRFRVPLWLKILAVLLLVSVPLTVLGAISPYIIGPILVLIPLIFPGRNPDNPTLAWLLPWFWGLEVVISVFFLVLLIIGRPMEGDDFRQPTMPELLSTIVIEPVLIWMLATRHRLFKPVLIAATVVFAGISLWVYGQSMGDIKARLELGSDLFTLGVISGYLLLKVRTKKARRHHAHQ